MINILLEVKLKQRQRHACSHSSTDIYDCIKLPEVRCISICSTVRGPGVSKVHCKNIKFLLNHGMVISFAYPLDVYTVISS